MPAAAATAAASPTAHRRQWAEAGISGLAPGHSSKNRDNPLGRLLAVGAVGAGSAHWLQFVEFIVTGRTVVLV